jgi:hypothetical protein
VERDSGLNLTCIVSAGGLNEYGQQWPKIFWFKDAQVNALGFTPFSRWEIWFLPPLDMYKLKRVNIFLTQVFIEIDIHIQYLQNRCYLK